ncbi:transporter substrate-binding domain-containing protein [Breoghania sp.]|uniref:transporter substrate-binding domain-containing protein n=1 Tax=Breoghania sp. TaxID=2065378 RepID=UPI002617983C|nr:transporter substrate-binding domain-containing protein [Breoghania sp.]MDJ0933713.1 transporter substrate-binding domain-containing protein [Breoghania sp.]
MWTAAATTWPPNASPIITEREQRVTFIDDAYASGAVFTLATNKSITPDPDTLCGLTVAIQQGFDFVNVVKDVMTPHCTSKGLKPITLNQYPSSDATLLALYSHRVDFVLNNIAASEEIRNVRRSRSASWRTSTCRSTTTASSFRSTTTSSPTRSSPR